MMKKFFCAITTAIFLTRAEPLYACAVCFGASADANQLIALRVAIVTILVVLAVLMIGIGSFFINIYRKSRKPLHQPHITSA